ncbi:type II secretion system protein F [Vandammella animalimorsus]|uniref:Type II secretion system protein F n=1 Tax=Vandammella animalimorsus TaxID=2029117 RepID=A0A2A2T7L9_9BURK|nr:type II secretion system F family protein [Vandammella animalimorsus]PAT31797.1 type II secretion system protein F [Vandammella animalimorsus]PAX17963.1 type II secretion system protein F [Vandammella animalimorsus]PAX20117.1 type II secretion system protein F [Vandammella animalimorsus]
MPDYAWRAANASGQISSGVLSAASQSQAMQQLRARGLHPLALTPASGEELALARGQAAAGQAPLLGTAKPSRKDRGPVNAQDVHAMTRELTIMLRSGLALDTALKVLIDMSHKPAMRQLVQELLEAVKGGSAFSKALAQHPKHFDDFYVNMIRSGEVSGQMAGVLARLVEHMERLRALRESVVSASIYPAILLVMTLAVLVFMMTFVVPRFRPMFADMGDALPLPTQILMISSDFFVSWGWLLGLALAALAALGWRWLRSPAGRAWWQARILRLPIIGALAARYQMTLFTRSWGTLLGNGVPMLTALGIATDTVSNRSIREPLLKVAPAVKEGVRVVDAMGKTGIFEPLAINLIRVGEETGKIGAMSLELADILDRQVETGIKRALTLLSPLMIVVLGVMVAFILIALMMGILSINQAVA